MNSSGDQPKILIIDDDALQADLMAEGIRDYYHQAVIDIVRYGAECLGRDLTSYDIILLDYNLPDVDGLSLLEQIRSLCTVPVVVVTGQREANTVVNVIRGGASDYIIKSPDSFLVLPVIIEKTLAMEDIKRQNRQLSQKIRRSNRQIRKKNQMLKKNLRKLRRMATHDPLTRLYNRRHFQRILDSMFAQAERYGHDLSCLMLDLDKYKELNDLLGHLIGDDVLCLAAKIMQQQCRTSDMVARYGGDEFVILLPYTASEQAVGLARRITATYAGQAGEKVSNLANPTVSIGIASLREHKPDTADRLVAQADTALYHAKQAGRGSIAVFDKQVMVPILPLS